jgi:hypothetical protein
MAHQIARGQVGHNGPQSPRIGDQGLKIWFQDRVDPDSEAIGISMGQYEGDAYIDPYGQHATVKIRNPCSLDGQSLTCNHGRAIRLLYGPVMRIADHTGETRKRPETTDRNVPRIKARTGARTVPAD